MLKITTNLFEKKFQDTYKPDEFNPTIPSDPLNRLSPADISNLIDAYAQPTLLEQVLLKKRNIEAISVDDIHLLMRDMSKEHNYCVHQPSHKFRRIADWIHGNVTQVNMGPETIDFLKEILPELKVIDWGSGYGYCSYVLRKKNVETVAIDIERFNINFIKDIEIFQNSFPRVEQLAKEGYALLMSRPFTNNAPNEALEAYENGQGECVIILGDTGEVANEIFWRRIRNLNKWCQIRTPKEAAPYAAGLVNQDIHVYKSAYGLCKQKVNPENQASIMAGLSSLLSYFEQANYYKQYRGYLDLDNPQYSWESLFEALKTYFPSDLHGIYQKFHAITFKTASNPFLKQAIAEMLDDLNDCREEAIKAAFDMLLANDQEDPIKTLIDIQRIFLDSNSLSECLAEL